ncbi:DUF2268 domain-containing putative Zn-dependent protease [Planococcus maritimus]|nr:DUF2268 domain-containing putative Zn-dependent protease [Planococcus sp. SK3692]MDE4085196.1 DUF2268 domain-containing putative Zn-dependent protease [Planococcus maritimus]
MISKALTLKKFSFLTVLTLYLLAGCSTEEDKTKQSKTEQKIESTVESTYTVTHNEQTFTVENYEEEMRTFLMEARESPLEREALYREIVHNKLRNQGVNYDQLEYLMFAAPTNLGNFEKSLDKLNERKKEIDQAVEEALTDSAGLLLGEDKTVHILPALPEETLAMEAVNFVTGIVFSKEALFIFIDPRAPIDVIKHTVAHEYHHTIYMELAEDSSEDLLEYSIIEGKADSFAKLLYPDVEIPWTEPMTEDEKATVLPLFMDHRNSTDGEIITTFRNGDYAQGIPTWSTYKLGYEWVQDYLANHPDLSVLEWTKLNQEEFLPVKE